MAPPAVYLWIDSGWLDVSAYVRHRQQVRATRRAGWQAVNATAEPATCEFVLNNLRDAVTGVGPWSHLHPAATYYGKLSLGTPVRVVAAGGYRFHGEISRLSPGSGKSLRDGWVAILAKGALGRRSVGSQPLRSAATTALTAPENDSTRLAYWPLEDEARVEAVTSPTGSPDIRSVGTVNFGQTSPAATTARMVTFGPAGKLHASIPPYTATGQVKVCCLWAIPDTVPDQTLLMRIEFDGGTVDFVNVRWGASTGGITVDWYVGNFRIDFAPNTAFGASVLGQDYFFLSLEFAQDGADIDAAALVVSDATAGTLGSDTVTGQTLGRIRRITVAQTDCDGASFGQLVVGNSTTAFPNFISPTTGGGLGTRAFRGESSLRRIERLATENDLPVTYRSRDAVSNRQGEQAIATLLDCLQEAADADGGMLFDDRDQLGITFIKSSRLMNQLPVLTVDCAQKHVGERIEPADTDTLARNDVTVTRDGGGKGRYTVPDADPFHYDTQDPPTGFGRAEDALTYSLWQDRMCRPTAAWWAHIGSARSPRFEQMVLRLHDPRLASVVTDALALDIGDVVQADNPPADCGPDPIRALVWGIDEVIDRHIHELTLHLAPADPWEVWALEPDNSTLAVAVDSDDTTLKLRMDLGPPWSTDYEPYHIAIDGEAMTVTTMTTETITFVGAGTAVSAQNAAGTSTLAPGFHASTAAGDVLLLIATIRNSGTGTPNTPAGWELLSGDANARVFGKVATAADVSAASVTATFAGGVANATITAQCATLRGASLAHGGGTKPVPDDAVQLNSSAANVATPALRVRRNGCVVICWAWKQDDTSGVTALSGLTEIGERSETGGDDASHAWDYVIQTTAADIAAGTKTWAGGAAAISRSGLFALRPIQTATVTRAVNGVALSHATGARVHAWRPGFIAL